ncbi:hypothetical protein ACJJTC_010361 [Scirpophaga incertulas]
MWERVADLMNSAGDGALKSGPEWSKYWVDLKAKLKRKNRLIRDARSETGGGPSTADEFTDIELKLLYLLGSDYGQGLPGVQVLPVIEELEHRNIASQSSTEDTIYLDVNFDDIEYNAETIEPITIREVVSPLAPIVTVPGPSSTPGPASTPASVVVPSHIESLELTESIPSRPAAATDPIRLRRRRRQRGITAAEARQRLVVASETRAQAELTNSENISRALNILSEMMETLKRIERK